MSMLLSLPRVHRRATHSRYRFVLLRLATAQHAARVTLPQEPTPAHAQQQTCFTPARPAGLTAVSFTLPVVAIGIAVCIDNHHHASRTTHSG